MELCLVRHAIAGERGPAWPDDRLRPLTAEGEAKMRLAALGLRALFVPDVIVSSPLLRAIQTAEILCEAFKIKGLHISDALASGNHEQLFGDVANFRRERVIAVGHEPFMSGAISFALAGSSDALRLICRKGSAALITFQGSPTAGAGTLEWLIQPAALRAAGRTVGGGDR